MAESLPKIAIIGYGSMGKEIDSAAQNQGFIITDRIDVDSPLSEHKKYDFDVAIDFSYPGAVEDNVRILTQAKKQIVVGTTGWMDHKSIIEDLVTSNSCGMVYGSNFSMGMMIFMELTRIASKLIEVHPEFDIMIHELHHNRKKDSPSGTALSLGHIIMDNIKRKTEILSETIHEQIDPEILHITSTRGGEITGIHTVYIDSLAETIELTHRAKNRRGFALGALAAARWIHGKKGFYDFQDMLKIIWEKE